MENNTPYKFTEGGRATFRQTGEQVGIIGLLNSKDDEKDFGQKYLVRLADFSKLQVFHSELGPPQVGNSATKITY